MAIFIAFTTPVQAEQTNNGQYGDWEVIKTKDRERNVLVSKAITPAKVLQSGSNGAEDYSLEFTACIPYPRISIYSGDDMIFDETESRGSAEITRAWYRLGGMESTKTDLLILSSTSVVWGAGPQQWPIKVQQVMKGKGNLTIGLLLHGRDAVIQFSLKGSAKAINAAKQSCPNTIDMPATHAQVEQARWEIHSSSSHFFRLNGSGFDECDAVGVLTYGLFASDGRLLAKNMASVDFGSISTLVRKTPTFQNARQAKTMRWKCGF